MVDADAILQCIERNTAVLNAMSSQLADMRRQIADLGGVAPVQELAILESARDFSKGNVESLTSWNKRQKARRKKA